jgi:TolB-like protein/class 3 adenylate cyclase
LAREQRKLAAIVAADVVGYSRLMGRDESGTLARLRKKRSEHLEPVLAKFGGRLVKLTGDGALIEFASAVDALSAAIEFQQANADQPTDTALVFRMGLHLGDLIVDGDDLYGDGVNIAARLEGEAPAGGIVISRTVHEAVMGRVKATFDDLGGLALKNIERPVQAFGVKWEPSDWQQAVTTEVTVAPAAASQTSLPMPDKPSIAVLPFQNMSGDPEQEYFTDGITEDIITELSRFHEIFVIARNSSFIFKGKSVDVRAIARDLGVRYVLEGSIRRTASRIRVTGQLVDAIAGTHIWAERYDRVLEDVFAVQEELTQRIVQAIAPQITDAELAKVHRRRPNSLSAYEFAVRAYAKATDAFLRSDPALRDEAAADARAALAIDPRNTIALNAIAGIQYQHLYFGTAADREAAWHDGMTAADKSIEIDRNGNRAHTWKGHLLVLAPDQTRRHEALACVRRGFELNPNDTTSVMILASIEIWMGNPERAFELLRHAQRISPRDPLRFTIHQQFARASLCIGQYKDGVAHALRGLEDEPRFPPLHAQLAMNYVGLGEVEKAKAAVQELRCIAPKYLEQALQGGVGYEKPEHHHRALVFLRIAAGVEDASAAEALR